MRNLPKNVSSETTRHGKVVYYFRKGRSLRVRLPDISSSDFDAAVKAARSGHVPAPRIIPTRLDFKTTNRREVGLVMERAVRAARKRATAKNVPFDLTADQVLRIVEAQDFKCVLSSIPFLMDCTADSKVHPYLPSIDRIEPSKGYVIENIRVVVYAINVMLMDWGLPVVERVMSGVRYTKWAKPRTSTPALLHKVRA